MDANPTTIAKQQIRQLKKQKAEILASSHDRKKVRRVQRKVKLLKRETRALAQVKKLAAEKAAAEAAVKEATAKAVTAAVAAAAKAAEASA